MYGEGGADWLEASAPRLNRDREATGHPHQKPLKIMRWLVGLISSRDQVVLDPFAGSGSTLVACHKTGRNAIGIEQSAEYIPIITKRLEGVSTPLLEALR